MTARLHQQSKPGAEVVGEPARSGPTTALVASVLVVVASYLYGLRARDVATAFVVAALVALASTLLRSPGSEDRFASIAQVAVLTQLGLMALHVGERFAGTSGSPVWLWLAGGLVTVVSVDATRPEPLSGRWLPLLLAGSVTVFAGAWVALNSGATIDVLVFQEEGATRLLAGIDPYLPGYTNIYEPVDSARFYGPGLTRGDVLAFGFPYPPLSLLLSTLGAVVGDVRVAHVVGLGLTTWLLATARGGRAGSLAAALFATNPLVIEVAVFGWTEPFLVLALAAWVWTGRRSAAASDVVLGLIVALKQYAVLVTGTIVLVELARGTAWTPRRLGRIAVVALVVTVPFALWHPDAFVRSVIGVHLQQPFRPDSLSLLAVVRAHLGWPPSELMTPILVVTTLGAVALAVVAARRRPDWNEAQSVWAASLVLLAFFLVAKQSFANYYFLVSTAIVIGLAVQPIGAPVNLPAVTRARP